MPAIDTANPYRSSCDVAVSPCDIGGDDAATSEDQIIACGPMTFEDFCHGQSLINKGSRKIGISILIICALGVLAMARLDEFWTQETLLHLAAGVLSVLVMAVVAWFNQKRSHRPAFESSPAVSRWLIDASGFEIESKQGKTFVPIHLIQRVVVSDRVAYVQSGLQHCLIPRAAFSCDYEWTKFLAWLQGNEKATGKEPEETVVSFEIASEQQEGAVFVKGPMNASEAACLLAAVNKRVNFFARNALILVGALLCSGAVLPFLFAASPIYVLLAYYPPCFLLGVALLFVHFSSTSRERIALYDFESWLVKTEGIQVVRSGERFEVPWSEISNLRSVDEGLLFAVEAGCLLVPRSGFRSDAAWRKASEIVRSNCAEV